MQEQPMQQTEIYRLNDFDESRLNTAAAKRQPIEVKLEPGFISDAWYTDGWRMSGQEFNAKENPETATIAFLGTVAIWAQETRAFAVQFKEKSMIQPAVMKYIESKVAGDYPYPEQLNGYSASTVLEVGTLRPAIKRPSFIEIERSIAGEHFFQPGYRLEKDEKGNEFVVEPDGLIWLRRSSSTKKMYMSPGDTEGDTL